MVVNLISIFNKYGTVSFALGWNKKLETIALIKWS